jgi:methyl coenzyme M reductase subunit C
MYTNIPQKELINVIYNTLRNNNTPDDQKNEIIKLVKTILHQNYFQHNNQIYIQEGLLLQS